jgi:YidC/Oxa1 family membrane protein insertase
MNIFTLLLTQPLANGLILFYRILGNNMGLAILAFTAALWVILRPLTTPYMESMKKIKDLTPQLDKLKLKYKDDKMKLAQAQADLYKENKINPGAGCLPYLLQIVILFAFFGMFNQTIATGANITENFNKLLYAPMKFAENQAINTNFLYLDITKPDTFQNIGSTSLPFALPGPVLILAALVQFLSAKIMQPATKIEKKIAQKTSNSTDDMQVAMQQSMIYTFPLMTLFVGLKFASGLALYWLVFSLMQAYQNVSTQGWGGLTPWLIKIKLLQSETNKNN